MHVPPARAFVLVIAALLLCGTVREAVDAANRTITVDDYAREVRLSSPALSPDGRSVAVVVSRVDIANDEDRRTTELDLVDVASGAIRPLTFERTHLGSPQWSPSGDRLAFLADDGGKEHHEQLYVLAMNGGDARRITNAHESVQQYAWRPDGNALAYVVADPHDTTIEKTHRDAFVVGNNDYLTTAVDRPSHLWLVSSKGGDDRRLTSGTWSVAVSYPPSPPSSPISWSPDGRAITFTRVADTYSGDNWQSRIMAIDVASGTVREMTPHNAFEGFGSYSPDGAHLAYLYSRDGDPNNENDVFVVPSHGGTPRNISRGLDRNIYRAAWMHDGELLVGGPDATSNAMWRLSLDGSARRIETGDAQPSEPFWLDASLGPHDAIAFVGSDKRDTSELWYLASPDAQPRRLTDFNAPISALDLGRVTAITWHGEHGFLEDGVLTYPPEFSAGRRYPLVLLIHGGPTASSTVSYDDLTQMIAARGYLVFEPNYRGSDNLGNAYQRAIFNDAGAGPGRDVIAGLDAVKRLGIVDDGKIAVSGWSYGGYMTSWMIGHYRLWKAAVSGAAVNDQIEEYDLSDGAGSPFSYKGSPYTGHRSDWIAQSPITYAPQVHTPTLILGDTGDARVPIVQSYAMYHALRDNGVPVEFVAYPISGHSPGDPVRRMDVYRRWIAWLDRYLR